MASNIYDIYSTKPHFRGRSQTVGAPKTKKKELSKIERHSILLKTVKELGYEMDVFHLRWMPGEYLDKDTLKSVPIFWFKKFGWIPNDIEKLYKAGQIEITAKTKREIEHVFGTKNKNKKRLKRKDSNPPKATFFKITDSDESKVNEVNTTDIYRRTRRLLKKVSAVPSKVFLLDNKSTLNIKNAGFPDLSYVTTPTGDAIKLDKISEVNNGQEMKSPYANINEYDDGTGNEKKLNDDKSNSVASLHDAPSTELAPVSESSENVEQKVSELQISSADKSKIIVKKHRSSNSIITPYGDMDTNSMINLRAKHRRTSSIMNRDRPSVMKTYGEIVWNKLAIKSGRGDTLSQRQFDIELQNNDILGDPDVCKELFKLIQSENPKNKKKIDKDDFDRVCGDLDKIPLVDEITASSSTDNDNKMWIVLKQVFVHIAQSEKFNINGYLTVKLTTEDLNDCDKLLEYLSSRHAEWTTRLQILEWITANLESSSSLQPLMSDINIGPFLLGWMTQCLDERSNLAKCALEMFPNIYSIAMTKTGESFQHLNDIFSSLFLVIRNKRSRDLNETANECFIQSIDMMMDWHEHGSLDNEVLLEISHILRDNTNIKEQKHDKVRERCVAYFGFIIYGIAGDNDTSTPLLAVDSVDLNNDLLIIPSMGTNGSNHTIAKSADYASVHQSEQSDVPTTLLVPGSMSDDTKNNNNNDDDSGWTKGPRASIVGQKDLLKIGKYLKRKYLLSDHLQFVNYMKDAINNGLNDKSGETRNTSFKLLQKLQKDDEKILSQILQIDPLSLSKFNKWKERNLRNRKKKSSKKKSNRKRIKKRKKNSITLTLGAQ